MKDLKTKISTLALTLLMLPFSGIVYADVETPESFKPNIQHIRDIYDLIFRVARWFQAFFFVIAAIFVIIAAFTYLTSGGDEDKIKRAKTQLIYAVIAIIVALLAFGVDTIMKNFLGGTGNLIY